MKSIFEPFEDYNYYLQSAEAILSGQNPYSCHIVESNYPPYHFLIYTGIVLLFGKSISSFRMAVLIIFLVDGILIFYLFQVLIKKQNQIINSNKNFLYQKRNIIESTNHCIIFPGNKLNRLPYLATFIYYFYPIMISRTYSGFNDGFPNFFFIVGFIFFFKDRHDFACIAFTCALLTKLTTLFIFPLLLIYFIRKKRFDLVWKYLTISVFIVILSFSPFLIDNFVDTVSGLLRVFQKPTFEPAYNDIIKPDENVDLIVYNIRIKIFSGISITLWAVIQICVFLLLLLFVFHILKYDTRPITLIKACCMIYYLLPILTLSLGSRYYYWAFPIVLILFFYEKNYVLILSPLLNSLFFKLIVEFIRPTSLIIQIFCLIILVFFNFPPLFYLWNNTLSEKSNKLLIHLFGSSIYG